MLGTIRFLSVFVLLANIAASVTAQQANQQAVGPDARVARTNQPQANGQPQAAPAPPFAPLLAQEQAELDQILAGWEKATSSTATLETQFIKYHYNNGMAPITVPATKGQGTIKYARPDRGAIKVDTLVFYSGNGADGQPTYKAHANEFGEHWICTGKELVEFDYKQQVCKINSIPENMQGKNIISSPLPFVFSLEARRMKERFWVRKNPQSPPDTVVLEVYPKRAEDRSQYRVVMVALEADFTPKALIMYAPNFDPKKAVVYDHYEFQNFKRNGALNRMNEFMGNFIAIKPPAGFKVIRQ
ncbi:MAG: TIGR03009 domain-containing protein [Planctomycetota bacterium]